MFSDPSKHIITAIDVEYLTSLADQAVEEYLRRDEAAREHFGNVGTSGVKKLTYVQILSRAEQAIEKALEAKKANPDQRYPDHVLMAAKSRASPIVWDWYKKRYNL